MLTKEHLRFRTRQGRVSPLFEASDDAQAIATAEGLLAVFKGAPGAPLGELVASAEAVDDEPLARGLTKLLIDRCVVDESDTAFLERRWRCFTLGEEMRRAGASPDPRLFRDALATAVGASTGDALGADLYGDLPMCRVVQSFETLSAAALIDRYNLAQVQGLLLRARTVAITVEGSSPGSRRELFRQLRFHRLMARVPLGFRSDGAELVFELTGPLSMFDQAASYGMRLANFFPHVLHFERWSLEAEVQIKDRSLVLKLDHRAALRSPYKERSPFIPPEFAAFVAAFNERRFRGPAGGLRRATLGGDFVDIGGESYCFPDITIVEEGGKTFHLELFHRWHAASLAHRIATLETRPVPSLILGVSRSVANAQTRSALEGSSFFAKNGFFFSTFPTPKAVDCQLAIASGPATAV